MPLTEKGEKILASMKEQYGEEKGTRVFYASINAGKIKGAHHSADDDAQHMGFSNEQAQKVQQLTDACDRLISRMDAFEARQHQRKPKAVKPKKKDNMQPSNPHPPTP
jgi:hypothetical protein